jgi:hypothetical protein
MRGMAAPVSVDTFESLGTFYLGRRYDLGAKALAADPVLYDSRDLVTHGVIVGMTGSGKTGLGITLLEEALIDNIPVLAIDPKGDLSNILLTFPDLAPKDFRPWVDADEAARNKESADDYAAAQAEAWKKGLAEWGQDGARIAKLKASAEFTIYTPGSRAGVPMSILKSFAAPPPAEREDDERMAEAVTTTATSILTLIGIDADPVQSREYILLSGIFSDAWKKGEDLDLAGIIQRIQQPPFTRVGVLDLQAFYPDKERFALAMRLNGLLAAPGFAIWLDGQPIDVGRLLYTPAGKPRCAVVSIAHLNDAERMFFVTLLLNQVVSWMRAQSGTTSLRALLYMDEVAGYMPPVANPPSKQALLMLMKQARAFGLGVVLATQNPVDLDYKGLSNAGTWFLGRLQTERDKARLLDGLEGAMANQSASFDRAKTEQILSSLQKRVFFMHNVHEDAPEIFQTRWALSYLRGPLTRDQIKTLREQSPEMTALAASAAAAKSAASAARASAAASAEDASTAPTGAVVAPTPAAIRAAASVAASAAAGSPPILPPGIEQFFVPVRTRTAAGQAIQYAPCLYASASIRYADTKRSIDVTREVTRLVPFGAGAVAVDWDSAEEADVPAADLETAAETPAAFGSLPAAASKAASYQAWLKDFSRWLYQTQELTLLTDETTGLTSRPDEKEADFRARVQLSAREARDAEKEQLRQEYAPKLLAADERIRKAEGAVKREEDQASSQKLQTALSFGSAIVGALFGRKTLSAANIGKATTAARGVGRSMKEGEDVQRASENVDALKAQRANLEGELEAKIATIDAGVPAVDRTLASTALKPKKTDIAAQRVVLVWTASA